MGRGVAWSFEEKHTPMGLISHSSVLYNAIQMTGKTTAREKSQLPLGIFVILVSKFNQTTAVRFLIGMRVIYMRMRTYLIVVVVVQATTNLVVIHGDPVYIWDSLQHL